MRRPVLGACEEENTGGRQERDRDDRDGEAVPEERAAFDKEVARLQAEVDGLKTQITALRAPPEPPRPPADLTPRTESGKTSGHKLPTGDDIKWARAAIEQACEKAWRQFVDMVADLQKDMGRKG